MTKLEDPRMPNNIKVEFLFRVWVAKQETGILPFVEIWYPGLEEIKKTNRTREEWISESFRDTVDVWDEFSLDPAHHWQVYGKATIRGFWSGPLGSLEYEEIFDIEESWQQSLTEEAYEVIFEMPIEVRKRPDFPRLHRPSGLLDQVRELARANPECTATELLGVLNSPGAIAERGYVLKAEELLTLLVLEKA